jgi:hypothetical protein
VPVIAAARLRKRSTNSVKGAHRLVADALVTAKAGRRDRGAGAAGALSFLPSRRDRAATRHRSCFSITARQDRAVRKAIGTIEESAWTPIKHTNAIFDEDQQRWNSDAEVAEIEYTAFRSRAKAKHVTARLIVRRVPDRQMRQRAVLQVRDDLLDDRLPTMSRLRVPASAPGCL